MCSVKKNLAEKWKLNLPGTDRLTSFKICSRFYFANSPLVELKALNIIKSLVISSTRNETGSNLGWVFCRFFKVGLPKKTTGFLGIYPGFWTLPNGWKAELAQLANLQQTFYPHKWSPVNCRSSSWPGKFPSQRLTFYHSVPRTNNIVV